MLKTKFIFVLLSISVVLQVIVTQPDGAPLVEISNGLLQGTLEKSYNGRTFSSFQGIPFAKPPVGELRFEPPQEPYNWTGTWIANTKHTCLQSVLGAEIAGDEDCLYLNVYVPREKPSTSDNLNVIVHIHGGGFMVGSGHFYSGPQYLMDEEVIFVTMNYRLGPFGFLSTEDNVVPGNSGMKDQALSLKWIQKNIKYFGGNPKSVTLTGMSAGGASVHLHYFSPLSKGLFHRGLSQSGTALNPWAIQEAASSAAKRLAVILGCPIETSRTMVNCLKFRSSSQLVQAIPQFYDFDGFPSVPFGPTIEIEHDGAFLSKNPYDMLINKLVTDVPWVASVTANEGNFMAHVFSKDASKIIEKFDEVAPYVLDYRFTVQESQKTQIAEKIKQHYFENSGNMNELLKLLSDRYFITGADMSAKLQAKANKSPVYFYVFEYRGENCFADYFLSNTEHILSATHGDDVFYYLRSSVAKEKLSQSDEKMKFIYLNWLTAYANDEEPKLNDITWHPVKDHEILESLYIKDPNEIYRNRIENFGSNDFWSKLFLKENEHYRTSKDEL